MAKNEYLISGIWKDESRRITDVFIHAYDVEANVLYRGEKRTEADVVNYIKGGETVKTIIWNYADWVFGADVHVAAGEGREHLATDPNANVQDNLDNLLLMGFFMP